MKIGICFDLDDTLYNQRLPFDQSIVEGLPHFPAEELPQLFVSVRKHSDQLWIPHSTGELSLEQLRMERLVRALKEWDMVITEKQAAEIQARYEWEQSRIQLYPEAARFLPILAAREDVTIGLITNGPVAHQMNKIQALGLDSIFPQEHIFISDAVGLAKPDPEVFRNVSQKLGLSDRRLYVGDAWHNDVKSSIAAGWDCIWYNPRESPHPGNVSPMEARSWDEIISMIQGYLEKEV